MRKIRNTKVQKNKTTKLPGANRKTCLTKLHNIKYYNFINRLASVRTQVPGNTKKNLFCINSPFLSSSSFSLTLLLICYIAFHSHTSFFKSLIFLYLSYSKTHQSPLSSMFSFLAAGITLLQFPHILFYAFFPVNLVLLCIIIPVFSTSPSFLHLYDLRKLLPSVHPHFETYNSTVYFPFIFLQHTCLSFSSIIPKSYSLFSPYKSYSFHGI